MDRFNRIRTASDWFEDRVFFDKEDVLFCTHRLDKYTVVTRPATEDEKKAKAGREVHGHAGEMTGRDKYPKFKARNVN